MADSAKGEALAPPPKLERDLRSRLLGEYGILIIVVVIMDFMAQLQAHLMSHQYEGLMKKANLRGYGRPGQVR